MTGSVMKIGAERCFEVCQIKLLGGTTSQWLSAVSYRSCFCIATAATAAIWIIEGLLPDGQTIELGNYELNNLFDPGKPRYITVNAMCGLPIRFVSNVPQANEMLWAVFKS